MLGCDNLQMCSIMSIKNIKSMMLHIRVQPSGKACLYLLCNGMACELSFYKAVHTCLCSVLVALPSAQQPIITAAFNCLTAQQPPL